MTSPRIAVVGGGMCGLMAALRLRASGAEPLVLEAGTAPGGMIRTVRRDGWIFETGAGSVSVPPALRPVLELAGPLAGVVRPGPDSQQRFLVHEGRVVPLPSTTAELVATPLLSLAGRMRFLKEPFVPRGAAGSEETMASFARRRFGEEFATRFFDPLVSGTTGGDPELLLARYTFPAEVEHERRSGSVFKGRMRAARAARRDGHSPSEAASWSCAQGLDALPRHFAASLGDAFRGGVRVDSIAVTASGVSLRDSAGGLHRVDGAVVALPAPALGRIEIQAPGCDTLAAVASMPHSSVVVVSLGYRRGDVGHPLNGHGLLAASSERRRILGVLFASSQFPDRAPPGHVLLTTTLGGAREPATVSLDDAAIVALVRTELEQLLGVSGEPVACEITRWPAALPLAVAGHGERLAGADRAEAAASRLAFSGTWRDGLLLRDVMQDGVSAADRLLQRL